MIEINDEETAIRYFNESKNATDENRDEIGDALIAWGEKKKAKEYEEADAHYAKLFTDDSYFQELTAENEAVAQALDPGAMAKRGAISAYLEHQLGREIPSANYEPERDAFAMANYGKKNLDDGQLFEAIRGTYDFQRQRTEAINDLHVQSVGKALADTNLGVNRPFVEGMTGVFNEWQQKYPELVDGKEDAAYLAQAYKLYYDTINDLDAVRPIAGKTLSTLDAFTKGNASGEDLQSLAQTLAQATPEDRDRVYKYVTLGAQAGQIDRAGIEQFAINLGQSFSRGFDFIPQGSLQQMESGVESFLNGIRNGSQVWVPSSGDLTKAVVGNASPDAAAQAAQEGAWRQASVGETETLIASANDAMQTFQVVRELRNVAKTGVDPIRPVMEKGSVMGAVEGGAYGVAGSIGFLGATAINPFLGVAAYQANEYDRIRLENPDMDIRAAQGLALVEGTWQAALDRVQLATLSGKLPVLGRFLGNIENNGIRRTLKVGASVAEQFGQELAQDTGTIVIDNIAAALREDMPDKDFAAEMAKYGEQIPETLAASVMFGLVGGGFATAADLGVTEQQMKIVGINDKKIARIKQATSPEEADALIQSALESRTSEDIEAGKTYARQVFNEAQNPPPESPKISLVAGQDGTDEYLVTAPDGSEMLRTKSQQAAMEAVRQDAESKLLTERNTVRDMVDYFRAQDPTNEATIEAPRTVQQELDRLTEAGDAKGIANLNERIRFAGIPEGADLTAYNILGEANVETTAEGVFKGVIRLRENSRPEDAFEEINHVFVRKALAEGRTDLDSLRGWLNQTSEATGETYATETETDIIENIAKVGMDYAAGRIEETSLPASFVDYIKRMLQVFKETMARAIKLKDAFATGKIDSNFESFLAESVGLNQQTMVDTTRERVGGELAQGTFNYSVGQRVLTDTNPFKGWFGEWDVDPTTASKVVDPDGKPMVVYHGTQRADRVGDRFRKSRATSGPMAFFTNDPAIASSYSTNKRDTSAEMPSDYAGWFKWKGKGMRSPVAIDRAWWNLSPEERAAVNERIYTIGYSDWDASEGPIVADSQSIMSRDSIDYELRQARGNGLRALVEMWLSSGSLFNQEERFLEVLQAAGVKGATLDDPNAARSAVYPVYLSIKNPLDTASIPGDVVSALEQAGKRKRAKQSAGGNPDAWDKNTISGNDWMAALKEDMAKGTTHAWTRIPDWVTETLSSLGYDGIKDTGGKNGGVQHEVWIPFNETQVKSATGNRGTFDPTSANINYSIGKNYSNEEKYNQIVPEISSVNPNKVSRRDMYEIAEVSPEVAKTMKFDQPIEVSIFADGTMMLSDGHHRLAAAKQLGMSKIPAVVRSINAKGRDINALIAEQVSDQPVSTDTNYSIGKKQDADYLAAVESGDMETVQKMVDEAAKAAGYNVGPVWRGAKFGGGIADRSSQVKWFTDYKPEAESYGGGEILESVYLKGDIREGDFQSVAITPETQLRKGEDIILTRIAQAIQTPKQRREGNGGRPVRRHFALLNPTQIKSADPVTRDEQGNVIPLSQRFDQTTGNINYSIASQSEIDRVNRALGGMNRGPDERLKVYQRARERFLRVMQQNKEELDAIRSAVSTNTAPAVEQVESERASKLADLTTEEATEVEKALQDNADTFMPRIEAAQTLAERKRVERDAKDRAKILEKGIRDKYAERKAAIDTEAKTQRQQIEQAAAAKDSAANARMRDKVRHTKLVTAIGELDGILKVLPPEVRGRVGGFAVLANIGTGDKAMADFFVKRIDMIDRQLERTLKEEYGSAFDALLERTKPKKAAAGEKPKGIGADIQSLFAVVREARNWSAEKVDGHIASIETQIASGNLSAQDEAMLTREADLVSLAGDWKNADSSRRAAALESAKETWDKGMSEFIQKKIREREDRDISRAEAISATGKKGDYVDRRKKDKADNGIKGDGKGWFMDTLAWDGVVNIFFGHESPMAIRLSDGQRKAEYAKIDAVAAKEEAIHDLFTKLAGGKRADGEKLLWQMSQPSIPANGLDLSEMEALSATMLWMQEDGRRHMEGELNENGMPVSKWHYDQKFIDEIESALSPEAKAVRDYLLDAYAKEWFAINSVYRELNGVNLPQIKNYSPVTVRPMNAPSGMVTDPVTGHAISATSISPGALRTRGTAIAEPAFRNVVQTYIAHTRQMEHWKAFAPWIKEVNGILRFRDVQDSIHEAGGEEAIRVLNKFLDAFAQGGNRDASLGLKISEVLNRMASRAAQVALIGRVGTLAIQTTQIGAASAELPMGAYVYRLGKLLTGNLGWGDSLNSAYIQRRLKQMPPIVQIAMEGLKAGKPNQLKRQVEKIGRLISGSDALWTAGTYAMVYDYNLGQAKTLGYTGKAAEDYAHNTAERITDRLAQPTRMGAKSIYEVTATNPGSRLGWAFASEARKNLALLAYTKANRPLKRFGATALGFIVFNLAMGAFIRNAWKDIRDDGDDEDEFFDSKTWNWKRIGVAMATEPLQGIPYLGDYIEKGINTALGQYHQSSDLISFERGVRAIRNIPDIVEGEREMADVLKDIDGMVSLMGLFNQNAASAASLTHIASDFFGVVENATSED